MPKFNKGKPYHGSESVSSGNLRGATGKTDYFYFFCPKCSGNKVLRILEYDEPVEKSINEYNESCKSTAAYGFTLAFKIYCESCGFSDFVKISNTGWQQGEHSELLS